MERLRGRGGNGSGMVRTACGQRRERVEGHKRERFGGWGDGDGGSGLGDGASG